MDTFMDKLAQKLTAQEMIKANSAADAEEMKQLKEQVNEYKDCLDKMRETGDEMSRIVSDKIAPELDRLFENSCEKLSSVSIDVEGIDELIQEGSQRMLRISATSTEQIQKISGECSEKLNQAVDEGTMKIVQAANESLSKFENVKIDTAEIEQLISECTRRIQQITDESLAKIQEIQAQNNDGELETLKQLISDKIESGNDFAHRECVKVYRNVQAVISESNDKQNETVNELIKPLKGKIGGVMSVSIAALIFSVLGVALQILALFS